MARILVVDDEPGIRGLLRAVLEEAGYEVVDARDGREAMRLSQGTSIDLLITDLVMPEKEGIELIRHFRKCLPKVKVIAISGVSQYLEMPRRLGADAVFQKPFGLANLLNTIGILLAR